MENDGEKLVNLFDESDFENIKNCLTTWRELPFSEIEFEFMIFAFCNNVFKVQIKESYLKDNETLSPTTIIYRKYSNSSTEQIERMNYIFQNLSKHNLAATFYGSYNKSRVEEFIQNSRVIKCTEINETDIRRRLATKLGKFHRVKMDGFDNSTNFIGNKLSDQNPLLKLFQANCELTDVYTESELEIIKKIKPFGDPEHLSIIRSLIESQQYPLVFSHNEIWLGNMLIVENIRDPIIIDYDTVGYSLPGYDVARILLETQYCAYENSPRYELVERNFPSELEIIDFIRYYLVSFNLDVPIEDVMNEEEIKEKENLLYCSDNDKNTKLNNFLQHFYDCCVIANYYFIILGGAIGKSKPRTDFIKFANDAYQLYSKFLPKNSLAI